MNHTVQENKKNRSFSLHCRDALQHLVHVGGNMSDLVRREHWSEKLAQGAQGVRCIAHPSVVHDLSDLDSGYILGTRDRRSSQGERRHRAQAPLFLSLLDTLDNAPRPFLVGEELPDAHIETVRSDFLRQFERVIATNPEELEGGRPKPGRLVAQVDVPANRRKTLRAAFQSRGSVVRHMGHLNTFSAPTS